jgi:SAM-dependent methyltransferase
MDENVYYDMTVLQEQHWWFKARREILHQSLQQLNLQTDCQILEIGCGTGGNMEMLAEFGSVVGMEMNEFAADYARNITGKQVLVGALPDRIPFTQQFDLICLFDVLEHIEDDMGAMASIKRLLKPGGQLILTVPAYQWMFGSHDRTLHHFRRYNKSSLVNSISSIEIVINRASYFNTLLLPVAILSRCLDSLIRKSQSIGYSTPIKLINFILYKIFSMERHLLRHINFSAGCSILIVGSNNQ